MANISKPPDSNRRSSLVSAWQFPLCPTALGEF